MTNIDLRLLTIIAELHRTRSVSQTAENLELSQSTVSMTLARLRKHFNDPLFVRTSSGMEPTPHAVQLIELLSHAESLLETALECHVVFDPATSDRTFHICSTDIAKITMLPRLMGRLQDAGAVGPSEPSRHVGPHVRTTRIWSTRSGRWIYSLHRGGFLPAAAVP